MYKSFEVHRIGIETVDLIFVQLMYLGVATPILYDFYNYDSEKPEFHQLFMKFTQVSNE